jgi:hypothetical protein
MATTTVSAHMSPFDYALAATRAGIESATATEIAQFAYRVFLGETMTEARAAVLATRNAPFAHADDESQRVMAVRMPSDLVELAHARLADSGMNKSTMHRFIIASAVANDAEHARQLAFRQHGGSKLRKER